MKYTRYILSNAINEFRNEYVSSIFSLFWVILQPLFLILIYSFVFTTIMGAKFPAIESNFAYTLFLCSGILPWTIFAQSLTAGTMSILQNASYVKKIPVPLPVYVIKSVVKVSFNIVFYLGLLLVFAVVVAGFAPSWHWVLVLIPVVLLQILVSGLSLVLSAVNVFFRDVSIGLPVVLQFLMWALPIVYPIDIIPERLQRLITMNPLYSYFHAIREVFLYRQFLSVHDLAVMLACSFFAAVVGYFTLKRLSGEIKDVI